jgi:hypothetical protein
LFFKKKHNQIAQVASQNCSDGTPSILGVMNKQVVYSFVAYTVGNHKDVTKENVSKELLNVRLFALARQIHEICSQLHFACFG